MVRQILSQMDIRIAQRLPLRLGKLREAIVTTVVLVFATSLPIGMPTKAVAKPISAVEQAKLQPARPASELPKPAGRADQLAGTVAQPEFEQLLRVPIPPTNGEIPDPSRSGGPVEPLPLPDWLMQLTGAAEPTYLPPYPVIRPSQEPAAEQTNVINVVVP